MQRYFLQPYVRACVTRDAAIFLDLRNDEYLGIDEGQKQALCHVLSGWSDLTIASGTHEYPESDVIALAEQLVARGLLTRDQTTGRDAAPIGLALAEKLFVDRDVEPRPTIRARHVVRFLLACGRAALRLRAVRLDRTVAAVHKRKMRYLSSQHTFDRALASELTHTFLILRLFLYTPKNHCLFDSLALIEFLAGYDLFPIWVFGVKTNPFAAHSWVQYDGAVLNGPPDFVRAFAPIVSV